MLASEKYAWAWQRARPRESLRAAGVLVLLPLIVVVLTAGFLGYAAWRLVYLFWLLMRLTWRAIRTGHFTGASARPT